jgi:hypothetical protein
MDMKLFACDTTLCEFNGALSTFPACLRKTISQSVEDIPIEEMNQLLSKHESDNNNFDGRIEANIRSYCSDDITVCANHEISSQTKFN